MSGVVVCSGGTLPTPCRIVLTSPRRNSLQRRDRGGEEEQRYDRCNAKEDREPAVQKRLEAVHWQGHQHLEVGGRKTGGETGTASV